MLLPHIQSKVVGDLFQHELDPIGEMIGPHGWFDDNLIQIVIVDPYRYILVPGIGRKATETFGQSMPTRFDFSRFDQMDHPTRWEECD